MSTSAPASTNSPDQSDPLEPEWLFALRRNLPSSPPSPAFPFLLGVATATFVWELVQTERFHRFPFVPALIATGLGLLAMWFRPRMGSKEVLDHWLRDKARADSYARAWSEGDLETVRRLGHYMETDSGAGTADQPRKCPIVARYLTLLGKEVARRRGSSS
jgi:hypothetical protein